MSIRHRAKCSDCGCKFLSGDEFFTWVNGNDTEDVVCPDCFDDRVKQLTRDEFAELLGSEKGFVEYEGF